MTIKVQTSLPPVALPAELPSLPLSAAQQDRAAMFAKEAATFAPYFARVRAANLDPSEVLADFICDSVTERWFDRWVPERCTLRGFVWVYVRTYVLKRIERSAIRHRALNAKMRDLVAERGRVGNASNNETAAIARDRLDYLRRRLPDAVYVETLDAYLVTGGCVPFMAARLGITESSVRSRMVVIRRRFSALGVPEIGRRTGPAISSNSREIENSVA